MTSKKPETPQDDDFDRVRGGTARAATFEVDHPIFSVEEAAARKSGSPRID